MTLNEALRRQFPNTFVHVAESAGTLFVQHLIVPPSESDGALLGKGYKIAKAVCWYADQRNMPIKINAERVENFDADEAKLEKFYARLGFITYEGLGPRGMIRWPQPLETKNGTRNQPPRVSL